MKIAIFGATGTIGRLAVTRMIEDGHQVTAFARHPEKLALRDENLTLFAGDATDRDAVFAAVEGQDAAVITIGAGMSRKGTVRSDATLNVIQAMQAQGVRRLICQSTLGAHESWSNLNFFWKRIMFGALLAPVFRDHELQEMLVRASGLDWTIVRPSAFTDAPVQGPFKEAVRPGDRALRLKIPRAEVAEFLRRQLSDARYLRRAVGISY